MFLFWYCLIYIYIYLYWYEYKYIYIYRIRHYVLLCLSCDVHIHVAIHMHTFFIYIDIFVINLQIHISIYTHTRTCFLYSEKDGFLLAYYCMLDIIISPEMILVVDTFCGVPVVAIVVAWAATHHVWSRRPETWRISLRKACCEHGQMYYFHPSLYIDHEDYTSISEFDISGA